MIIMVPRFPSASKAMMERIASAVRPPALTIMADSEFCFNFSIELGIRAKVLEFSFEVKLTATPEIHVFCRKNARVATRYYNDDKFWELVI
jgi:hypothetical protein